jgi:hypothetical protein
LPLLFHFDFEYDIRRVWENQMGLKLNGTHQLLAYADAMILLGDNIDNANTSRNTETLMGASLDVNLEKTKYMFKSLHQNAGQNRDMIIGNR